MKYIIFLALLASCGPSRDPCTGQYWKATQVKHRIFSRNQPNPYACPKNPN